MNTVNLILLGVVGYFLYKRTDKQSNITTITDNQIVDDVTVPEVAPIEADADVEITELFDESYMKSYAKNDFVDIKAAFLDYSKKNDKVIQNGVIAIKNISSKTILIEKLLPSLSTSQSTQNGGQVSYPSINAMPITLYVASDDDKLHEINNIVSIRYLRKIQYGLSPGDILYLSIVAEITVKDKVSNIPYIISTNFDKSPAKLSIGVKFTVNTSKDYDYLIKLPLSNNLIK